MSPENEAALQAAGGALALLGELHFSTGVLRQTTWGHSLDLMGYSWTANGLVNVGAMRQAERIEYPSLDLTVPVVDPAWLSMIEGQAHTYRGRLCKLWLVVMDHELSVVADPELIFAGTMDKLVIQTGNGTASNPGTITLKVEQPGRDTRSQQAMRLSDAQQQADYPGDTGLSRMAATAGNPQVWVSERFQRI